MQIWFSRFVISSLDKLDYYSKTRMAVCNFSPQINYVKKLFQVFSSENDGSLSFDDFLDLHSAFSEQASREVKTTYAFKIYDFDNDGLIGEIFASSSRHKFSKDETFR